MVGRKQLHPVAKWLRGVGITALLLGLGTLMLAAPNGFWFAVAFVYGGLILLILDVWLEPELKKHPHWIYIITIALIVAGGIFSWLFVFVSAPLGILAETTDAAYPKGSRLAGIDFRPEFTELRIMINNPSDRIYENLSLLLKPNEPVAKIGQDSNIPNVYFHDKDNMSVRAILISATKNVVDMAFLATTSGYIVQCPRLASKETLTVVMAIAHIKEKSPTLRDNPTPEELASDRSAVLRIKSDFDTYWFGHPDGDVYEDRPNVGMVEVDGTYDSTLRERHISEKISLNKKTDVSH